MTNDPNEENPLAFFVGIRNAIAMILPFWAVVGAVVVHIVKSHR